MALQRREEVGELYKKLQTCSLNELRSAIRSGAYRSHTAGLGQGHLQANLAIMPESYALDFMRYCQRNPKPCPLVGISDTGNPMLHTLGADIDVRTDIPSYNIYREGKLVEQCTDIASLWDDDMVAFALGCSFTFEHALQRVGIPIWHIDNNIVVPMFRSSMQTVPAGVFGGNLVVSMRAIDQSRIQEVTDISSRYPLAHGSPVHIGDPADIGITSIAQPDWGDPAPIAEGQTPVFWACGVTPQEAIAQAALPLCITHTPGHMLITDIDECAHTPAYTSN